MTDSDARTKEEAILWKLAVLVICWLILTTLGSIGLAVPILTKLFETVDAVDAVNAPAHTPMHGEPCSVFLAERWEAASPPWFRRSNGSPTGGNSPEETSIPAQDSKTSSWPGWSRSS